MDSARKHKTELLNPHEQKLLLQLSRKTLENLDEEIAEITLDHFRTENAPLPEALEAPICCFVTLTTRGGRLRGCIGMTQTNRPLYENVHYMTLQAALRDPRFRPVERREVKDLHIHLAVLGPLQPLVDIRAIEIGKHGLYVRSGRQSGLLLASVAADQGWTPEEFRRHTCQKAGLAPEMMGTYEWSYFEEFSFSEKPT